jgi:hypothetical protein
MLQIETEREREMHVTWVGVLTARTSTYVELPAFCAAKWLRTFNFVISFYFLVSIEEIQINHSTKCSFKLCVIAAKIFTNRLKLLDGVCDSGVQALVVYFV